MKLRHAAAIVPCAIALTACTAVTSTQNADLAGRSLMWADGATEECEVPPSIKFGADGKVSGNAGCNLLVGGWTLQGDKLDLSARLHPPHVRSRTHEDGGRLPLQPWKDRLRRDRRRQGQAP